MLALPTLTLAKKKKKKSLVSGLAIHSLTKSIYRKSVACFQLTAKTGCTAQNNWLNINSLNWNWDLKEIIRSGDE